MTFTVKKHRYSVLSGMVNNFPLEPVESHQLFANPGTVITGFANGWQGRMGWIENVGPFAFLINHQDAGSLSFNRLINVCGQPQIVPPRATVQIQYDNADQRWRILNSLPCVSETGDIITIDEGEIHVLHTAGSSDGDVITRDSGQPGGIAWRPVGGAGAGGRDLNYFRQKVRSRYGTRWYVATYGDYNNYGPGGPQSDFWFLHPFISPGGGVLDGMRVNVVGPGSESDIWSLAIYDSVSKDDLFPNNLLVDMGIFTGDGGGSETMSEPLTLDPSTFYWLAFWGLFPSGTLSLSLITTPPFNVWPWAGVSESLNPNTKFVYLKGSRDFDGEWPDPFPESGAVLTDDSDQPVIGVRYQIP